MQPLEKLSEYSKATALWTPGHQKTPGDKEADRLAKQRATGVPADHAPGITFIAGKCSSGDDWDWNIRPSGMPVRLSPVQKADEIPSAKYSK
jgi:hypothetical protein